MKQMTCLLLSALLALTLCACSSPSPKTAAESTPQTTEAPTEEKQEDTIEFEEPVLVAEDAKMKVELLNFFQESTHRGGNDTAVEKFITLKFTNKTGHTLTMLLSQLYFENDGAYCIYMNGTPEAPAGKSIVAQFMIQSSLKTPLDSMEQLYRLSGAMTILEDNGGKRTSYTVPFSFADGVNGSVSAPEPVSEKSIGDTVSTDMAEFTLTAFEFRKGLYAYSSYGDISSGTGDMYAPEEGMVFAMSEFTLRNLAKEAYHLDQVLNFTVDYNDGYRYTMKGHECHLSHEKGIWHYRESGGGNGQRASLDPLMGGNYKMFLPAIDLIETDTAAPLRLTVTLPASGGSQEFTYRIR